MTYVDINSIEGLINAIDEEIDYYKHAVTVIYRDYNISEGNENKLPAVDRAVLHDRIVRAHKRYQDNSSDLLQKLDRICKRARKAQPNLGKLEKENLCKSPRIPHNLVLGRLHVKYKDFDEKVSRTIPFPLKKPIYINDEADFSSLHKLFLRLMYTMPLGKCTFRILDRFYRGAAVQDFNLLFEEKSIFPDGCILVNDQEMKKSLEETLAYAQNMIQHLFTPDCPDWEAYNRMKYSKGDYKRMLEYKVVVFFGMPNGLNSENFDSFRALINICERCGILVVFSYSQNEIETIKNEPSYGNRMYKNLEEIIGKSINIKNIIQDLACPLNVKNFNIEELEEDYPDKHKLAELLQFYKDEMNATSKKAAIDFNEIMQSRCLFKENSCDGLNIPVGERSVDKNVLTINIDDSTPHYLIGGTSGSGKSNLLHVLISSACWRYSPSELEVYLLDFKMGTEFNIYATGKLPHARLVAISDNDKEYGVSVLDYLEHEMSRRSEIFKAIPECSDYKTYRTIRPEAVLQRILVIVDEFQVLLQGKGAMDRLINLAKQGRSFGMHMIFATQTLRGLDFSSLGTQFRGRIALNCEPSDSELILGGMASNNAEAAEIKKPFAIINTGSGSIKDNIKFLIPLASKATIKAKMQKMNDAAYAVEFKRVLRVYKGDEPVKIENFQQTFQSHSDFTLTLGKKLNFEEDIFRIKLKKKEENNVLIVGKTENVSYGLLKSAILSGLYAEQIDQVVYVGPRTDIHIDEANGKSLEVYNTTKDLLSDLSELKAKHCLYILDGCNFMRELDIVKTGFSCKYSKEATDFFNYLNECNEEGSFVIAFYESFLQLNKKGLAYKDSFLHRICFGMSESDLAKIGDLTIATKGNIPENRSAYIFEAVSKWFRPFTEIGEIEDEQ